MYMNTRPYFCLLYSCWNYQGVERKTSSLLSTQELKKSIEFATFVEALIEKCKKPFADDDSKLPGIQNFSVSYDHKYKLIINVQAIIMNRITIMIYNVSISITLENCVYDYFKIILKL